MALYHKYRPRSFDEMSGNEDVLTVLQADLAKDSRPHAYLFHGPSGCGKTTLARIIATELGCEQENFHEVDSADFRGIETIREIRKNSQLSPLGGGDCQIWLLDECHKLSNDAQNALLKALEDTPSHVYYILATTDPDKLIATIRSRCTQYQVNPLTDKQMFRLIRRITKEEGETLDQDTADQIIENCQGRPRDALQILDQVLGVDPEDRKEAVQRVLDDNIRTRRLCQILVEKGSWKSAAAILKELEKQDEERIRRAILGYCSKTLLNKDHPQAAKVMEEMVNPLYNTKFPGLVFACYSALFDEEEVPL
jgi:DNA polymerase-3 subunit gamma/tau